MPERMLTRAMEKFLEHLGYATPVIYAAAAYWLFSWLDKEASDEAKAALSSTMRLKILDGRTLASALVEVFDWIYTRPLLGWRAAFRSILFTLFVSLLFLFELFRLHETPLSVFLAQLKEIVAIRWPAISVLVAVNVLSDYVSLFVIRRWFGKFGAKPVFALVTAALIGVLIVNVGMALRVTMFVWRDYAEMVGPLRTMILDKLQFAFFLSIPASVVFVWLPLFALGILVVRALTPLSWIVTKAQWLLKDGNEHPLKAVGYVAAIAVFIVAAGWQTIFKA
jgi:hypothetical protein